MRTDARSGLLRAFLLANFRLAIMMTPDESRLEALAEFAAGAGHEINNPLATIVGRAQLLLRDETDATRRDQLLTIIHQAYRVRDMIGDVMLFARPPRCSKQVYNLQELVLLAGRKQHEEYTKQGSTLTIDVPADLTLYADRGLFLSVMSELLRNARIALRNVAGTTWVTAAKVSNHQIEICCRDNGCGISDKVRDHLFDPFFSGRQAGRGLGFGLCKVWRIAQLHGATIDVRTDVPQQTEFRLVWPADAGGEHLAP